MFQRLERICKEATRRNVNRHIGPGTERSWLPAKTDIVAALEVTGTEEDSVINGRLTVRGNGTNSNSSSSEQCAPRSNGRYIAETEMRLLGTGRRVHIAKAVGHIDHVIMRDHITVA